MRVLAPLTAVLLCLGAPAHAAEEAKQAKGSGLLELSVWQGMNGLSLGVEMSNARNGGVSDRLLFGTIGLLAGTTIPALAAPDITTGQAMMINLGSQLGALNGIAAWGLLADGTGGRDIAVGQLVGTLGGAVLARARPPEVGRMAMAQSAALWLSVGASLVQGSRGANGLIVASLAADAGAAVGYALWPSLPLSRGTLRAFDWAAGIGLVGGVLAADAFGQRKSELSQTALVGLSLGALAGVGVVYLIERSDAPTDTTSLHVLPTPGGAMISWGGGL